MARKSVYISGLHAVKAALAQPGQIYSLWVDRQRQDRRMAEVLDLAREQGVEIHPLPRKELDQRAGNDRHQGVLAACVSRAEPTEQDIDSILAGRDRPLILILDGVQDPHNLGACLRSADAAGVCLVIVPKDKSAPVTQVVHKVAAGATGSVPLVRVTNLARTLRALKEKGIWLVGTAGEGSDSLYQTDLSGPLALVMGAEGSGLRRLTAELCDFLVHIPMLGAVESLNVSVATGVCLFEALRQRQTR